MANRDQSWGRGGRAGEERWRRDENKSGGGRGPERRSFNDEGGEPWRGESRYGARYDQDRSGYGGQEYGMEGGPGHRTTSERDRGWRGDERETDQREQWSPGGGEPYGELELNARNRGIQEFGAPHDYAYHPRAGHEFDPDYLHWREEQMRGHDRDYHEWRRTQRDRYDEDYRRFRSERREHFGRSFDDWRNQRNVTGGIADTSAQAGVSGYGDKVGMPSGYDANASDKPSGMIETSGGMNASPGASQGGGGRGAGGGDASSSGGGDRSPEFGKAPPGVQAAAGGWDGRGAPEDQLRKDDDGSEKK